MTEKDTLLRVHWLRHGRVASHQGDMPLTDEGLREVEHAGRQFCHMLVPDEAVTILHAPTLRTRETDQVLYRVMMQEAESPAQFHLSEPLMHEALRNPAIYVAGKRVELVSSAEALVEQVPDAGLSSDELAQFPFWHGFWGHPDRIGYWVNLANPPGEDADAVARRLFTFAVSLLDLPRVRPQRYICITHSPVMRAFLRRYLFGSDPGEPDYVEAVDMVFAKQGACTIRYRDRSKEYSLSS